MAEREGAGGVLAADRSRWIAGRATFLFPVRALSTVFRAEYLAGLHHAFDAGQPTFAEGTADLADCAAFAAFLRRLRTVDWVVYAKRPFAAPSRCSPPLGGTPTASRSRTIGSSITTTATSGPAGRTTPTTIA